MSAKVEPSMNGDAVEQNLPRAQQRSKPRGVSPGCSSYSPAFNALSLRVEPRPNDPDLRSIQARVVQGRRHAARHDWPTRNFERRPLLQSGDRLLQPFVAPPAIAPRPAAPRTISSPGGSQHASHQKSSACSQPVGDGRVGPAQCAPSSVTERMPRTALVTNTSPRGFNVVRPQGLLADGDAQGIFATIAAPRRA